MARAHGIRATLAGWPNGWRGSWPLLGVLLGASVAATCTDPRTWRAILVVVTAPVAILTGSSRRLAAPFVVGVLVLPIENVLVFLVQIGRGIASMPWWIALSVIGAVLLIIAVTYERRTGENAGLACAPARSPLTASGSAPAVPGTRHTVPRTRHAVPRRGPTADP